ncbi:MAG: CRTAC1 family protein, partial [Myxococcota bacterium]|nr:CRTAC1 family protein [Myxococcota bacterium]
GDLDVYLCHDSGPEVNGNLLLENDGAGGLAPATDQRGLDVVTFCMGISWGDVNADGLMDAYLSTMTEHYLLLRDPSGGYYDVSAASRVPSYIVDVGTMQMGWGTSFVDVENDGRMDLVLGTADFSAGEPESYPLWYLRQQENGRFEEVSIDFGLPQQTGARGLLTQDINGDGLVDFLLGDMARTPYLLLSDGCTAANWMEVTAPDGTEIVLESEGVVRAALATSDPGFSASGFPTAHFGLGSSESVDRITLRIPGGEVVVLEGPIEARRRLSWTPTTP